MENNKKNKILYVITKSNWGGAQKYVYELATSLPKDKFDIGVILGGNGVLAQKLNKAGIRVINLENLDKDINIFKEFSVFINLLKIFKKESPDIVHLNSSKIGGLGSLAGRLAGIQKIIFTAHGFAHNEDRPATIKFILLMIGYLTILLSHKTIIINKRELDQISKLPFLSSKLELIYIGIGQNQTLKIEKEPNGPVSIGTISELTKNKGLEYMIEAVARLKNKNITFAVIGEGEDRDKLTKLIEERGVTDLVQLLGFKENASSYISLFDIFTLTSLKEGMPYAILEAGLVGLPVIASDVGGISEMIENDQSGILVQPKNVEQIVEGLSDLISNFEKRRLLGENLKKNITQNFSIKEMLDRTKNLYLS
jgi:glycosyltransferase involved in cell wall biosynthesis